MRAAISEVYRRNLEFHASKVRRSKKDPMRWDSSNVMKEMGVVKQQRRAQTRNLKRKERKEPPARLPPFNRQRRQRAHSDLLPWAHTIPHWLRPSRLTATTRSWRHFLDTVRVEPDRGRRGGIAAVSRQCTDTMHAVTQQSAIYDFQVSLKMFLGTKSYKKGTSVCQLSHQSPAGSHELLGRDLTQQEKTAHNEQF